jgi:hypothetical protein
VRRVLAYLLRFAVILVGYAVASLAASVFIHVIFLASAGFRAGDAPMLATGSLLFSVPFVALFVAYFGFIPSAAVVLAAEILGRRDWLSYAIGGGIVAAAFLGIVHQNADPDFDVAGSGAMLAVIGAGMVGGLFYWLSAGRWAGSWRGAAST